MRVAFDDNLHQEENETGENGGGRRRGVGECSIKDPFLARDVQL